MYGKNHFLVSQQTQGDVQKPSNNADTRRISCVAYRFRSRCCLDRLIEIIVEDECRRYTCGVQQRSVDMSCCWGGA